MKWRTLLLVTACAFLSFGGTFTCKGSTHDNSVTVNTGK